MEMTQLLAEDQPVPDDENAKKPAILKHQSIILTDDELKELGMKDVTENAITCEITEEEEYNVDAECEEKPTLDEGAENNAADKEIDSEAAETDGMDASTGETDATDDCNKENGLEGGGDTHENDIVNGENGNESNDLLDPDSNKDMIEAEPVNEEETPKAIEKSNEIKQKPPTRPISGHKFKIPAMWTPANPRANAAFVYIFFRHVICITST